MIKNNVIFKYPERFEPVSEEDGILSAQGAKWFLPILKRVPGIQIDSDLCQEDWGVVIFSSLNKKRFWIGLSMWPEGENAWLVHVHHHSFAFFQRFSISGKNEIKRLIEKLNQILSTDPRASDILWFSEKNMISGNPKGSSNPKEA
jgi:hypothetical protein